MPLINQIGQSLVLLTLASLLASCQTENPLGSAVTAVEAVEPQCDSFNKGDDMRGHLDAPFLNIKAPTVRSQDEGRGISTVLLPGTEPMVNAFWAHRNSQGNWAIADKQTVVRIQPGELDAQLLHRLNPKIYPRTVLFIVLPQDYWDKEIALQPVLEKQEARWGKVEPYTLKITAQGMVHPFQGLHELGNSGDRLPNHLNRVLTQVESGSIYLPNRLSSNVKVLQPTLTDPTICPKSGS